LDLIREGESTEHITGNSESNKGVIEDCYYFDLFG
jgi:hypothetical protein